MMRVASSLALIAILALPVAREVLEQALARHALVQLPLLVLAGIPLGRAIDLRWPGLGGFNENGVAGLVVGVSGAAVWMLPRSMDAALASPLFETLKLTTVPALVGLPLGASWARLGPVARVFVLANVVSMLWAVGWLYAGAPVRVCNFYLRSNQVFLGELYLALGFAIFAAGLIRALAGPGVVRRGLRRMRVLAVRRFGRRRVRGVEASRLRMEFSG